MTRTADLKVNGFAENATNCDIAKTIVEHFASQNIKVLAIQQCPNKTARVTFDDKTACEIVQLRGELEMDGVKVSVVPPPPPPPNWVNVVVYNYPYDAPDSYITDALESYGNIQGVRYQHWTNLPEIATGTRIVRINLKRSIPRFVMVHTYRCKVWYRGQPTYCDICKGGSHIAFNCPYKGKCLGCKGIGHFARNCPTVCFKCKGGHASDSCPNRRRWEHTLNADEASLDVGAADAVADVSDPVVASATASAGIPVESDGSVVAADIADALPSDSVVDPASVAAQSADGSLPSSSLVDDRFNQLDEILSQSDDPQSQSVLAGLSEAVEEACATVIEVLDSSDKSAPIPSSGGSEQLQDSCMVEPSAARKRVASELSSSDGGSQAKSKPRGRKALRTPGPHVPPGVSSAAEVARSRSSSGSRSSSRK